MSASQPVDRRSHTRRWQFSLFTLLVAMTCVGLACVALISTGELWKGLVFVLVAGSLLVAGLCIVYRDGRSRAFAVGFVIFGSAYFVVSQGDTPDVPVAHTQLPTTRWGISLYTLLHGENVQLPTSTTWWAPQPVPVPTLSPLPPAMPPAVPIDGVVMTIPAYSDPAGVPSADPAAAQVTLVETPVNPPIYLPPPVTFVARTAPQPVVPLSSFLAVVHHLLVIVLGVLGGIVAQFLHATRRQVPPPSAAA